MMEARNPAHRGGSAKTLCSHLATTPHLWQEWRLTTMAEALVPPFTETIALAKVQKAEDLWNTRDPEKVALAYTEDCEWRNRVEFIHGRQEIVAFLRRKWATELDYRLKKKLFGFRENRIAVTFEYEWHDETMQWFRSYGIELWEFNDAGVMFHRQTSINDAKIDAKDQRVPR
jgi:uncharacterized protein